MNQMTDAKKRYEEIPIPEELSGVVQNAIDYSTARKKKIQKRDRFRTGRRALAAAAAVAVVFTVGLNTSTAFAESMSGLPVIGPLARVLTFRSYGEVTEDLSLRVEIPGVELIRADSGLTDALNEEIYERCEEYAQEARQRAEEYKEAFLATGGTQEEWEAHDIRIQVEYEIKAQTEQYLSFAVTGWESWVSAYNETRFYNLDVTTGESVTLQDLLGDDCLNIAEESIRRQMAERTSGGEAVFFTEEEGGFAGLTGDEKFYINEAGNPVIVFDRYEIAPGSEGMPEFEIAADVQSVTVTEEASGTEAISEDAVYEDNFSVDAAAAEAFAEKIQKAVAAKDLEALADLAAFPVYVGVAEEGGVNTREDFLALGADRVITPELMAAVEGADIKSLTASKAGFVMSADGRPNIIFGVADGKLAVTGFNY